MRVVARCAPVVGLAAALVFLTALPAQGTPILTATVTPVGGLLRYEYSIEFNPLDLDPPEDEIQEFTITGIAGDTSLTREVAPAGYVTDYDIGLGLISFFPDVGFTFPTSGVLSGFGFDTELPPGPTTFEALTINFDVLTGPTIAPVPEPVPEPATVLLLATGLGALGRRAVRRRARSR